MKNLILVVFLGLLFFPFLVKAEGVSIQQLEENAGFDIDYAKWYQSDSGGSNPYDPYYGSSQDYMSIVQTFVGVDDGFFTKVKFKADTNFLDDSLAPRQPNNWSGHVFSICEGIFQVADFEAPIYGSMGCQYPYVEVNQYHIPEFKEMYDYTDGTYTIDLTGKNVTSTIGTDYYFVIAPPHYSDNQYGDTSRAEVSIHWDNQYNYGESWYQYYVSIAGYVEVESALLGGDLWFQIWTDTSVSTGYDLEILNPSLHSHLPLEEITVSGTCSENGTNILASGNTAFDVIHYTSADFTIDCVDSNFSYIFEVEEGLNQVCIFSEEAIETYSDEYYDCITFTGDIYAEDYLIEIFSPNETALNHYDLFAEQEFPFNFHYISEDIYDINFRLRSYTDDTYNTVSSTIANQSIDYFESFDGIQDGYFWLPYGIDVNDGITDYYRIDLYSSSTLQIYDTNLFSITGTSNLEDQTGDDATQPDIIYGYCNINPNDNYFQQALKTTVCWAFIGDFENGVINLVEDTRELFSEKVPFAYFYHIEDLWEERTTSTYTGIVVDFTENDLITDSRLTNWHIDFLLVDDLRYNNLKPEYQKVVDFIEDELLPVIFGLFLVWLLFKIVDSMSS